MFGHSKLLHSGNPGALENFEKKSSVFGLERWTRLGNKEAWSSWQGEHQWEGIRIKGSVSSLYSAGLVPCQGLDGHPLGAAAFSAPSWAPAHLLLLTEWGRAWLTAHVNIGNIHAGWHAKGLLLPLLEINPLLTELFLRAEMQEVPWVSCCYPLEKLVRNQCWTCDSHGAWHRTQGVWSGSFRKPIDWTSDKPNIKCKSLCSSKVVYLRTKFKVLKDCLPLGQD